ncbi:MAG: Spy/CpxP family protein refolding chaperone [Blastocatellia bacterium]|nr:Spy/CpxP family protein refolding chaperone [Blastocatellia bacterium]
MQTKTKRIAITLSVAAILVAGAVFAVAQTGRQHGFGPFGGRFAAGNAQRMIDRVLNRASVVLGLTDEQETQIKAILETAKPTVQPLVAQLAVNHKALAEATANGAFNETQVKAIAARQGDTLAALIVEKERVKTQIYAILTPEQRAQAEQIRERIENRLKDHFGQQ